MSYTRKATFLATGGTSGLFIKSNSKKERIAKALEEQNRLLAKQQPPADDGTVVMTLAVAQKQYRDTVAFTDRLRQRVESTTNPRKKAQLEKEFREAERRVEVAQGKMVGLTPTPSEEPIRSKETSEFGTSTAGGHNQPHFLADELTKLADLHDRGRLDRCRVRFAKAPALG